MKGSKRRLGVRQVTTFDCGPGAGVNILATKGVKRTIQEMRRLMGTTTSGTSPTGLVRGLRLVAHSCDLPEPDLFNAAYGTAHAVLAEYLRERPVVLPFCTVKPWDHWVVALYARADRVCVQDSAADGELRHLTWAESVGHWAGPDGPKGQVFGVAL